MIDEIILGISKMKKPTKYFSVLSLLYIRAGPYQLLFVIPPSSMIVRDLMGLIMLLLWYFFCPQILSVSMKLWIFWVFIRFSRWSFSIYSERRFFLYALLLYMSSVALKSYFVIQSFNQYFCYIQYVVYWYVIDMKQGRNQLCLVWVKTSQGQGIGCSWQGLMVSVSSRLLGCKT